MKKGQITIFLIIGVIFVVIAGIIFFMRSEGTNINTANFEIQKVPAELTPIKEFTDSCIKSVSKEALQKIGFHGGYIDPLDTFYTAKTIEYDLINPTSSDVVFFSSNNLNTNVPFWWYMESSNDCRDCVVSNKNAMSLEDMENQINLYVDNNLNDCLKNYKILEVQKFFVTPQSEIKTTSKINDKDITIKVDYSLKIKNVDKTYEISEFLIKQPLELKKLYNLAQEIVIDENLNSRLENFMINFISIYSGKSSDRLPPFSFSEESFTKKIWVKYTAGEKIKNIINNYVPLFSVKNTHNYHAWNNLEGAEKSAYNSLNFNVSNNYEDIEVHFYTLNMPIYFDIKPNQGQLLTSYRTDKILIPMYMGEILTQNYEFYYDVSFPVIVELRMKSAFRDEGYSFMFAMEGNLRNNHNLRDTALGKGSMDNYQSQYTLVGENVDDPKPEEDKEIDVADPDGKIRETKTLFCNVNQRLGSEVFLNVTDQNNQPIKEGMVKFGCGLYAKCNIGSIIFDPITNSSTFSGKVPICLNGGYVSVENNDYKTVIVPKLTSLPDRSINLNISMKKFYLLNVTLTKLPLERTSFYKESDKSDYFSVNNLSSKTSEFVDPDMVIIKLVNIEDPFAEEIVVFINKKDPVPFLEQVKLLPGIYEIDALYMDQFPFKLEPDSRGKIDGEPFFIPEETINFDVFMMGGVKLNKYSGYWEIKNSDLIDTTSVDFKILSFELPLIVEDLQESSTLENLSYFNREELEPVIS